MKYFKRIIFFLRRVSIVWKDEGLNAVFYKSKAKLIKKFHLRVNRKQVNQTTEDYYRDVYDSYLSVSHNDKDSDYVELPAIDLSNEDLNINLIAFYLPQFYPIPENDSWWGRGFTEWTNVSKASPQFVGHYQPHLPGELGFYDLRVPEVQRRQVELAKKFGIFGFCFYYYWFNGKRLLESPLDQFISDKEIEFPFCLCWANENWTRRWDGLEDDLLIAQEHSIESDFAFIRNIEKYLKNERYIRINGRPLLIVYRPQILPDPTETAKRWRQYCKEKGVGNLYLIAVQTAGVTDPRLIGFDAAVEFPPHGIQILPQIQDQLKIVNPNFRGMVFDFQQAAASMMKKVLTEYTVFKTVMTSWDNTARRQNQPLIFHNGTPKIFQSWLTSALEYTLQNAPKGGKFVFINAWNEWAEGAHLEPDRKYGYAYLQATANALGTVITQNSNLKMNESKYKPIDIIEKQHNTAIILHLYYHDLWEEIASYLDNLNHDFDLYVSIPQNIKFSKEIILQRYSQAFIYRCPNRGRDIWPFIKLFSEINKLDYKYICKIHTKKSTHRDNGDIWRKEILNELLGSFSEIEKLKLHLDCRDIGIIGPRNNLLSTEYYMGGNETIIKDLANKLNLLYWGESFNFIAGSMFWFKPSAISPILRLSLNEDSFPFELGQRDCTLAHAIERLICLIAYKQGYKVIQSGIFSEVPALEYKFATPFLKDLNI